MPERGQFFAGVGLGTNRVLGQFAFVESPRLRTVCGQSMTVAVARSWTIESIASPCLRTVRGHGQFESAAGIEPVHDRRQAAFAAMSNVYCAAVPRLHRDRFVAMKTCHPAGVGRALT